MISAPAPSSERHLPCTCDNDRRRHGSCRRFYFFFRSFIPYAGSSAVRIISALDLRCGCRGSPEKAVGKSIFAHELSSLLVVTVKFSRFNLPEPSKRKYKADSAREKRIPVFARRVFGRISISPIQSPSICVNRRSLPRALPLTEAMMPAASDKSRYL